MTERPESVQPVPPDAKRVFQGAVFDVYQWEQQMFDGSTATFEKLKRADTVIVYPILPDGTILLLEEEQPGRPPFIGAPGGRLDPGETPEEGAARELLEESGYQARTLELWDARQPTTKIDWVVYTFIAKGLTKVADLALDPGEKISPKPVTFDEFLELGSERRFAEKEIACRLVEAKLDPEKYSVMKKLFAAEG